MKILFSNLVVGSCMTATLAVTLAMTQGSGSKVGVLEAVCLDSKAMADDVSSAMGCLLSSSSKLRVLQHMEDTGRRCVT